MNDIETALGDLREKAPPRLTDRVMRAVEAADDYVEISGPRGSLFIAFNEEGTSCVDAAGEGPEAFEEYFVGRFGRALRAASAPPRGLAHALETGDGRKLRYDLRGLTEFEVAVLRKALEIPKGEVRSYGWIAREIGRPKAVRAVGSALGHNPVPVVIPCHRVVRSDGMIGNYALGAPMKRELLDTEGVDVEGIEQLAASGVRYVGSDTTHVFCVPTCHDARRVTERHRVTFRNGRDATAHGYRPCKHCRPAEEHSA
ncbi:MAG TPA: methylated-DNA--[protein]-cysteine S-methyltransferase [Actinomycetota bacterium]|jgi:O-6-methylguanine DNA methyltransferase